VHLIWVAAAATLVVALRNDCLL